MASDNPCACDNSSNNNSSSDGSEGAESGQRTSKSRGPHAVHRKKYKPSDLNTTGFQCNYETCEDMAAKVQSIMRSLDIQCDIEPDEDDSICSKCRCTSGFCNAKCELAKQKISKNKSDTCQCQAASTNPVAVKQNSLPGLQSAVVEPQSSCKCVRKCVRECEKNKLMEAVAAMRDSKPAISKKNPTVCVENQCRSACNIEIQTDLEEPPIAPIAQIPDNPSANAKVPQTEASNVCIACQCDGPCSVECTIKRHDIKQLITPEDMKVTDVCETCECSGKCTPACDENKLNAKKNKICDVCKCTGICTPDCKSNKDRLVKESQTDSQKPTVDQEIMAKDNDDFKETQTPPAEVAPMISKEVVCTICKCVGVCNNACKAALSEADASKTKPTVCEQCACINKCTDECQSAKSAALRICDECICNATCTPKCDEIKRAKKNEESTTKICEVCQCCGKCLPECELLHHNTLDDDTTDGATQLKGIIEDFNDDDVLNTVDKESGSAKPKAKSTCNVAEVCETCDCTDTCQPKCAAIRKIKSVADFPPSNTVCDACKCTDICTKVCDLHKSNHTCFTAAGQPIKCNNKNSDWIPCASCKPDAPCSPECRERLAMASVMPKVSNTSESKNQGCEAIAAETCATTVQTTAPTISSNNVQTVDANQNAVGRSTSTPHGTIDNEDLEGRSTCGEQSCTSCKKTESDSILHGLKQRQSGQGEQGECGMCVKLRGYICSMLGKENTPGTCADDKNKHDSEKEDKKKPKKQESCNKTQASDMTTFCRCIENLMAAKQDPPRKGNNNHDNRQSCKCSGNLGKKKSSYTDRMQHMMSHLRASCEDAEVAASPYIKTASVFPIDVNIQQEAIATLLLKCKEKDNYIDALIEDVLDRSTSKRFVNLLDRLKEQNPGAPDFDGALISSALDTTKSKNKPVCGIDLSGFKIYCIKRIGATSLLVKWNAPADARVCGYDININGQLKTKIESKDRNYAILDALDFSATISIEIYAMAPKGRAYPSILAYYAKY